MRRRATVVGAAHPTRLQLYPNRRRPLPKIPGMKRRLCWTLMHQPHGPSGAQRCLNSWLRAAFTLRLIERSRFWFKVSQQSTHEPRPTPPAESVCENTWMLLISVMLLNKTSGALAIPVFRRIVEQWNTPEKLAQGEICSVIGL